MPGANCMRFQMHIISLMNCGERYKRNFPENVVSSLMQQHIWFWDECKNHLVINDIFFVLHKVDSSLQVTASRAKNLKYVFINNKSLRWFFLWPKSLRSLNALIMWCWVFSATSQYPCVFLMYLCHYGWQVYPIYWHLDCSASAWP